MIDRFSTSWEDVFPAYAGMSPATTSKRTAAWRFPRLRGDEPPDLSKTSTQNWFSPPTRG